MIRVALLLALWPRADAPLVGRPSEHYYGAVGERVRIEMRVSIAEMRVEEPFILTVMIQGVDNPERVQQPDLRQLPEFADRFHIEPLAVDGPPRSPLLFRYRLRPKNERVNAVPPLLFHYYHPRLNYFAMTAPAGDIALKVTPRTESTLGLALDEPEWLYEAASDAAMGRRSASAGVQVALLTLALLVPPGAFFGWRILWRLRNPTGAKLAALRRSQAVREALDQLARKPSPERIAEVVRHYLQVRWGIGESAATRPELIAELKRRHASAHVLAEADALLEVFDAARFAPANSVSDELATIAEKLILTLELPE